MDIRLCMARCIAVIENWHNGPAQSHKAVNYITSMNVLSSANEGLDCSVTLPDSPMMFQQTRSSRPVAKLKTVSGHHPTGGADLSPHGSISSAGTREYRWLMLLSWLGTDRFGGKSQRRDATADRFAPWWWWWWWWHECTMDQEL